MINLKDIKPTLTRKPFKMIVYGKSGIGKSTFAAGAPSPLFVDIENGADALAVAKVKVSTYEEFYDLCKHVGTQEHDFKTLVVDSIDWFEKIIKDDIIKSFNESRGTAASDLGDISRFGGIGQGYQLLEKQIQKLITALDWIRNTKNMNIILLAHEPTDGKTITDLIHGQFTRYDMKLEKKTGALLAEWADFIFRASRDLEIKVEGRSKGAKGKAEYFDRMLYTHDDGRYLAKTRIDLPEKLDLNYAAFNDAMEEAYKALEKHSALLSGTPKKVNGSTRPPVTAETEAPLMFN